MTYRQTENGTTSCIKNLQYFLSETKKSTIQSDFVISL